MKKIYIWGAGHYSNYVYSNINQKACSVIGIVDNSQEKQGQMWNNLFIIESPNTLSTEYIDYVVISPLKNEAIKKQCIELGISQEKIIDYWSEEKNDGLFKYNTLHMLELEQDIVKYKNRLQNAPYEWGLKKTPTIKSSEELLIKIINEGQSLCRYGDGEFEIMFGNERPWFQCMDKKLSERLKDVICSDEPNILIAIAQNFGCLDDYKESMADIIREYMSETTRQNIMQYIDIAKVYYNAYVTRPYIIYKDKRNAEKIFPLFKQLLENRNVVLVEGKFSKIGLNNDLFQSASSIKRIICPDKNAWDKYDEILSVILSIVQSDDLICISLGPTATVLAYDIAKNGIQAIDIGQIDNEYDWFLSGAKDREKIRGKLVAEIQYDCNCMEELSDVTYTSQIIYNVI